MYRKKIRKYIAKLGLAVLLFYAMVYYQYEYDYSCFENLEYESGELHSKTWMASNLYLHKLLSKCHKMVSGACNGCKQSCSHTI